MFSRDTKGIRKTIVLIIIIAISCITTLFIAEVRMERTLFQTEMMYERVRMLSIMGENDATTLADAPSIGWVDTNLLSTYNTYKYPSHPGVVAIYSQTGELIHRSGSMLEVYYDGHYQSENSLLMPGVRHISLEQYITEEEKREFFANDLGSRVRNIKYLIKDGEFIPISMSYEYEGMYNVDNTFEIDFTDTNGLDDQDYETYEIIESFTPIAYMIDDGPSSDDAAIYRELYSAVKDKIEPSTIYLPDGTQASTDRYYSVSYRGSHKGREYLLAISPLIHLNIDDELVPCYIYVYIMDNMYKTAWKNEDFARYRDMVGAITVLLIAGALLRWGKKKRELTEESKRVFVSAAAHELKTPISIIQNQSECILEGVNPEKTKEYVASIHEEAKRMGELVNTIQQYDRLDHEEGIVKTNIDLSRLAQEEVERYEPMMRDKGITIETDIAPGVNIIGDEGLIKLVIDNYLSNATKYAAAMPAGGIEQAELGAHVDDAKESSEVKDKCEASEGALHNGLHIKIRVSEEGGAPRFSVFNTHEAIPDVELAKAWQMLYKIDDSRHRDNDDRSGGMGLAICGKILELHRYKYGARNVEGGIEFYFVAH